MLTFSVGLDSWFQEDSLLTSSSPTPRQRYMVVGTPELNDELHSNVLTPSLNNIHGCSQQITLLRVRVLGTQPHTRNTHTCIRLIMHKRLCLVKIRTLRNWECRLTKVTLECDIVVSGFKQVPRIKIGLELTITHILHFLNMQCVHSVSHESHSTSELIK